MIEKTSEPLLSTSSMRCLNPILSASRGASSPGGASGGAPAPDLSGPGAGVSSSARMMALELPRLEAELRQSAAEVQLKGAQESASRAAAAEAVSRIPVHGADKDVKEAQRDRLLQLLEPEKGEIAARTALSEAHRRLVPVTAREQAAWARLHEAELPQTEFGSPKVS